MNEGGDYKSLIVLTSWVRFEKCSMRFGVPYWRNQPLWESEPSSLVPRP